MTDNPMQTPDAPEFSTRRLIGSIMSIRVITDSSLQLFYPFLPIIAAGLRIDEASLGQILSLRSLMGLGAPLFGAAADKRGYKLILSGLLLISAVGMFIIGSGQSLLWVGIGLVFSGIGLTAFNPTLIAYLSSRLPFERRSRGLGILEYSWGLAGIIGLSLIGVSLIGQLIGLTSWRAPFFVLGGGMVLGAIFIQFFPAAPVGQQTSEEEGETISWKQTFIGFFDIGDNWRSALSIMIAGLFIRFGTTSFFINYGTWFVRDYRLTAGELGTVAFVLGFSDFLGSGLVSLLGDRLGKRRSMIIGCLVAAASYLLLPLFNISYFVALIGAFIARAAGEFMIVSSVVLMSEQAPEQRGKVMALNTSLGRLSSAATVFFAPTLFAVYHIQGVAIVAAGVFCLAAGIVFFLAQESAASNRVIIQRSKRVYTIYDLRFMIFD